MRAIVCDGPGKLRLATDVPKPEVETASEKVLVKVDAVALNHSDWKMADFSAKPGAISGFDMAGTVVGPVGTAAVKDLSVGDGVLGVTSIHGGAFAEYAVVNIDLLIKVPEAMTRETAATFGVGIVTAGLALYGAECLGLAWPSTEAGAEAEAQEEQKTPVGPRGWGGVSSDEDSDEYAKIPVLVYGASTATGTLAVQLLRLSGYEPVAVCSPRNFGLVQSRGAGKCFDYHSSGCAAQIKQYTNNRLAFALDCITTSSSMRLAYDAMGVNGGKYVSLDPYSARVQRTRPDIEAFFCYALTVFGLPIELDGTFAREAKPEDRKFAVKWMKIAETLIAQGRLLAHPMAVKTGGLEGVIDGIDLLRKGKISGEKLVFSVS